MLARQPSWLDLLQSPAAGTRHSSAHTRHGSDSQILLHATTYDGFVSPMKWPCTYWAGTRAPALKLEAREDAAVQSSTSRLMQLHADDA